MTRCVGGMTLRRALGQATLCPLLSRDSLDRIGAGPLGWRPVQKIAPRKGAHWRPVWQENRNLPLPHAGPSNAMLYTIRQRNGNREVVRSNNTAPRPRCVTHLHNADGEACPCCVY